MTSGRGRGQLVVVMGASGGVGASVLASAVAVRAVRAELATVLVDGCPWGGGLDVIVGAEHEEGIRWPDLQALAGAADGRALLAGLPQVDGLPVLSFRSVPAEPPADVADAVLSAFTEQCELVVVDAPVSGGAVADAALRQANRIVMVAGDGLRQLLALSAVAASLRKRADVAAEMGVCLRVASGATAGAVARLVEAEIWLDVLGTLEEDRGVSRDLVHGVSPGSRPRGPLVRAADEVLGWVVLPRRGAA